ncbi:MAG: aspartate kinase [Deltaproteobacteria bacterium]
MPVVVQKYGGSSVASLEKVRRVAGLVAERRRLGAELVVVVSAMGDTTDELLALAKGVSPDPPRRELDMLLSAGERISMALLSMALHELKVPAISFTGSQSGILTDESHSNARIVEVRPGRIQDELGQGKVVIVAGYQGVSRAREVTTLGRGGSDTTAVALAAALSAEVCEIYSDVDGVWSADPRLVPAAQKLDAVGYGEMQALARAGAKVLNAQAVEWAKRSGVVISARQTGGAGTGTRIVGEEAGFACRRAEAEGRSIQGDPARPGPSAVGVALLSQVALLRLEGDGLGTALELLARAGVSPHQWQGDGARHALWLSLENVHGFPALCEALRSRLGDRLRIDEALCAVSAVGHGLCDTPGPLRSALATLSGLGAPLHAVAAQGPCLSLVTAEAHGPEALRRLHGTLVG